MSYDNHSEIGLESQNNVVQTCAIDMKGDVSIVYTLMVRNTNLHGRIYVGGGAALTTGSDECKEGD